MKKLISTLLCSVFALILFGQSSISGVLTDKATEEPLIGATVYLEGTDIGAITDFDGNFTIENVDAGTYNLIISYVGYAETKQEVVVGSDDVSLGSVMAETTAVGIKAAEFIASKAIDRRTPVAVSTISAEEIEANVSNLEFPEVFRSTPSVYVTRSGGGYGDARINLRGFNQRNMAIMINGIPVNDMENGWVYWSNWAGLSEVANDVQIQRGLGASKLAISSVGGTINVVTKATELEQGGYAQAAVGNDGYQKYSLKYSSGKMNNGWAFSFLGSRTQGNGYIDGAYINAWNYFASIGKEFGANNQHQLILTALGAPQTHGQRTFRQTLNTYVPDNGEGDYAEQIQNGVVADYDERTDYGGEIGKLSGPGNVRFNSDMGIKDGEIYNIRENFYHKPQFSLNHYWTINNKAFLATSLYYSMGRGGGTGDRGSIDGRATWGYTDANGHVRVDDIVAWNQGRGNIDGFPEVGNASTYASERNGLIRRASMNEHNWVGLLSKLEIGLNDNLNLIAGIDVRQYTGLHYRKVVDLLGTEGWVDPRDVNAQSFTFDVNGDGEIDSKETGKLVGESSDGFYGLFGNPGQEGKIHYDNDGVVGWQGAFGELEYNNENFTAFGSLSLSNTSYTRVDRFNYLAGSENETSETFNFFGYNAKVGANINIDRANNIFVNAGYYSRAPGFDAIFPRFNNVDVNADALNEQVLSFEAGYGLRAGQLRANINYYYTSWQDRTFSERFSDASGIDFFANIQGIDALHQGLEVEVGYTPIDRLRFDLMGSFGNWEWKNDVEAIISDEDNNVVGNVNVYADGLKVGDAAQTTIGIRGSYTLPFGLGIDAEYQFFDNLYAEFDPSDRSDIASRGSQPLLLPSYGLLNAGLTYNLPVGEQNLRFRLRLNNALDELYIAEANDADDLQSARGYFGFGRTWTASVKYSF